MREFCITEKERTEYDLWEQNEDLRDAIASIENRINLLLLTYGVLAVSLYIGVQFLAFLILEGRI